MCGIIGVISANSQQKIINGLINMQYRGYDSCGMAYFFNDSIKINKTLESPKILKTEDSFSLGIGHTRWATHGKVSDINAHPILSFDKRLAIVHNGVIENSNDIKREYLKDVVFDTETDTEVLINLIAVLFKTNSLIESIKTTTKIIKGSYAFMIINLLDKESIYLACDNMPLILGVGDSVCIASDILAFDNDIKKHYKFPNKYVGKVNLNANLDFNFENFKHQEIKIDKENKYHMYDEILYEREVIKKLYNTYFENCKDIKRLKKLFKRKKSVIFIASGTSYNACRVAEYYLNKKYKIKTNVYLASEFIYNIYPKADIYFIVSQSGETADTIKALNKIDKNSLTISLTNVKTSTIAKMTKYNFDMLCGPELSVASTKAYIASIFFFYALFNDDIKYKEINSSINRVIIDQNIIKKLALEIKNKDNLIFLGRGLDGISNLENILKIKEITYLNVESYFGGELKHGPLALINEDSYVFIVNTNKYTNDIMRTNTSEVITRGGKCFVFSSKDNEEENDYYSFISKDDEAIFPTCVFFQMLAYFIAINKNNNPDRPKNLAKSVTVE